MPDQAAPTESPFEPESPEPALARAVSRAGAPQIARTVTQFKTAPPPGVATLARAPAATTGNLSLGSKGLELIKSFEGVRLTAYQDSVGVWTIGYGHTGGVRPGQRISQAQADDFLRSDCARFVNAVNKKVKVALNQNQFDALVSLSFNLGENGWKGLLSKLNAGDYKGAQAMFTQYVHAGGRVLGGLVRRRKAEAELFGSGGSNEPSKPAPGGHKPQPGKPDGNGGGGTYTVKRGDTLWAISRRHGMNLKQLLAINPQFRKNPDLIFPGQKVSLGKNGKGPAPHKGKEPDKPNKPKPPQPGGSNNAGAIAARYLGRNASELKRSKDIPMDPNVPNNVCCANFVSACLELAGLISHRERSNAVRYLAANLKAKGWKTVGSAQAKPGDVIILQPSHTELVFRNDDGKITLIGSNNRNPDGSQRITEGKPYGSHYYLTPPN